MCVGIANFLRSKAGMSPLAGGAGTAPDTIPEDPQGDGSGRRDYRRRRRRKETAGDYWDSRRNRDRAWETQPDPKEDLRIPEPDINDPNPTPDGGINY